MKIHSITQFSSVNGPGERTVIHFQGCRFQCPGCFNPETHSLESGTEMTLEEIIDTIPFNIDGVTISGGEPFLQQKDLFELVDLLFKQNIPIIIFSGYYRKEIEKLKYGHEILSKIDALIDGRFEENIISHTGLHGSDNQTVHLLSNRYAIEDFHIRDIEFIFDETGKVSITGFPNDDLLSALVSNKNNS
ncbi:radical SAM protein [Acinetobacter sp. CUI P1]|nr:radical SAM protein [Acinetobacter sp. CUI P1]